MVQDRHTDRAVHQYGGGLDFVRIVEMDQSNLLWKHAAFRGELDRAHLRRSNWSVNCTCSKSKSGKKSVEGFAVNSGFGKCRYCVCVEAGSQYPVSYTHLDVYKRQEQFYHILTVFTV